MLSNETVLNGDEAQRARALKTAHDTRPGLPLDPEQFFAELTPWREALILKPDGAGKWRDLAGDAVEHNPFFEPWALVPALERFASDEVRLLCVWDGMTRSRLMGVLPVVPARGYARAPVGYWKNWLHPHCYFGAPLIRCGYARAAAEKILSALCDGAQRRAFLHLSRLDQEGRIAAAFAAAVAGQRIHYQSNVYERAALFAGAQPDAYFAANIRKKKRKELQRLRNRLEEYGPISIRRLTARTELEAWTGLFLRLEDKGWKAENGTSLNASPADAAWFRATVAAAFDAGKLDFLRLDLGGQAIAMLVSFGVAERYSLKICHDPAYSRYSPGVMIELEATRLNLDNPGFSFVDSCAARDHPMINSLWKDRRRIAAINISGRGIIAKSVLRFCRMLETARAALADPDEAERIRPQ